MIPFLPNFTQLFVLKRLKEAFYNETSPARLFILKARQTGISTLIEAVLFVLTSQQSNMNSLIIADDVDGSNYLFEMSKLYHEKLPVYLRPALKKSNEKKLEFEKIHSQILIDTAQNKEAGRKYTFQVVHLSEYAFFTNVEHLMLGLRQTVPPLPRTLLIIETTANGFNHAKEEWDRAVNGETDYIPIFIPWYWTEEYKMPVPKDFRVGDPQYGEMAKAESDLEVQILAEGISQPWERLQWRRWCIKNNCEGKVTFFQQEYPSTPEEAFIASGDCAFDKEVLVAELKKNPKPLAIGNIVEMDGRYEFRPASNGDFLFYEKIKPRKDEEYVIGGDACSGSGTDYAGLVAISKRGNNTVATYHRKADADQLAEKARLLGCFLHDAVIAIENDKYGFYANMKLRERYGNIFVQKTLDKVTNKTTEKFGWDTNTKTRADGLGLLKQAIRQKATEIRDRRILMECLTFVKNAETGKEEAQEGCNDDMVMSRMIAGAVREMIPYEPIAQPRRSDPKDSIPDY